MDDFKRIVFCGSHDFAVSPLEELINSQRYKPLAVITQPDRPAGRNLKLKPTPVKELALKHNLKVYQPQDINSADTVELLKAFNPDFIVVIAYGLKVKKAVRDTAIYGAVNLHPSLLPELRGAAPVPFALFNGMTNTGLTIFELSAKMDAGAIYRQQPCYIFPTENATELLERLSYIGSRMLVRFLDDFFANPWQPIPQDEQKATYCRKLDKDDLLINWNKTALEISNQIRALALSPGAYTLHRDKQLKILSADIIERTSDLHPGSIVSLLKNTGFMIQAQEKQLLIRTVQPAGKQAMSAWAYHLGARLEIGEKFGQS